YEPDWKTADFDGVASFFAPMQVRSKGSERPKQAKISDTRVKAMDSGKLKKKLANADDAKKEKLKEAAKWDSPKFLEGAELKGTDSRLWRKSWAKWVIARDNTQTQRYVANRFWSFLFGMGILNPVDDFNSFNEPSHPELLALLGNEIRDHGFDIKRFYRAVMKTRTWQLASRGEDKKAEPWHFAAYPVRQLTPEQFFAALIVVRHESASQRGMRGGGNPYDKDLQQAKAYQKRVEAGKIGKNEKKYEWDVDAIEKLKAQVDKMSDDWYLRRRVSRDYSKFSDDDEMMEADGFVLTIDQALLVMNGDITAILSDWGKGSVLDGITSSSDKLERQIERMFLVALSRKPDDSEAKRYKQFLKEAEDEKAAWEDALFTLLVSTEFATNH
ncbi:MAG: DUF1553 domain-containing protein, partial [Planctomycetes bacterium]|nr:DUF1553 domain-containing protein [Planctomycetota bacterium]